MMPSAMKSSKDSPRSVHLFLRFEEVDAAEISNAKKVGEIKQEERNSNPPPQCCPNNKYNNNDQLPLGSSSFVKKNFVIRKKSSFESAHSAPTEARYNDMLPLGCPPQYSGARPKPKNIFDNDDGAASPTSTNHVTARYTSQLAASSSPLQENWNLVHEKSNRFPSVSTPTSSTTTTVSQTSADAKIPLVQSTTTTTTTTTMAAMNNNQVTKLIQNFENAASTRKSREAKAALAIQTAFRRFAALQRLDEHKTTYRRTTLPRLMAVVKIQTGFRAWISRMKFRLASLEKDLECCQNSKEYSLAAIARKTIQANKQFEQTERHKAGEHLRRVVAQVCKTQKTITDFRLANKKYRTQNQTLAEASAILTQKCAQETEKHQQQLQEIAALQVEIEKLKREEKRLAASAQVYPKFVRQFSETLEQVNEHVQVESKSKLAFSRTIHQIVELVKETCQDEELVHEIVHLGTTTFLLKDTTSKEESGEFQTPVVKENNDSSSSSRKKWQFADISETETSETSSSGEDDEEEQHAALVLAKMIQGSAGMDETTFIQLKD